MKKVIVCKSCAAEYDASLVRCPYCGTAYAPAEEEEYMGKLEGIREDLHRQKDKGDARLKKKMSSTVRAVLVAVIVIVLLVFGILWLSGREERSWRDRKKQEFLQSQGITLQQEVTDR